MKKKILLLLTFVSLHAWCGNPVVPGFFADPEILYAEKDSTYYIYSTTDGYPGWGGWTISVFSSKDLQSWKAEGAAIDVKSDQVPWATGYAWAPCIIERKTPPGKKRKRSRKQAAEYTYYLYFSAHNPVSNRKEISVATSNSPTGPFKALDRPIITDKDRPEGITRGQAIDVDVFQDPVSGKYYLYWGNSFMAGAELNDDMISIKPETRTAMTPAGGSLKTWAYREGTYVFYNELSKDAPYYFMWSVDDTGSPNYHVCYGTSDSPLGPINIDTLSYRVIEQIPEKEIYGTAHNSVIRKPGTSDWLIVYHRINKDYVGKAKGIPGTHREICIDNMFFDPKGRIIHVKPTNY